MWMVPTWRNSFFLNLEKTRTIQGQVRTDIYNDKQTNDETEISTHIFILFSVICIEKRHFLMLITIQSHFQNVQKSVTLDGGITEKELLIALQSMENKKSPRNDGLTRVLYSISEWNKDICPNGDRESLSCKTIQCTAKTTSNKINCKEGTRQKVYSKQM